MAKNDELTPIRKQYLDIKRQHPDCILFFRLGDFYETFDDDAEITAKELDIVLTSRNVAKGRRVPMAGIPHHALDNYLGRLIEKGYHVAICEQVGEEPVGGLFPRRVVRVVTPGTVVEPELLPGDRNNYLAAVVVEGEKIGFAYVDISTGEFAATEMSSTSPSSFIRQELIRLRPAEVLAPEGLDLEREGSWHLTTVADWRFQEDRTRERFLDHFGVATLRGHGLEGKPQAARAAGAIIDYLEETQASVLKLLTEFSTYSTEEFMVLDSATRRNLELTETLRSGEVRGSLLGVLDRTVTPMGRRLLNAWIGKPLLDIERIDERLDQVECFFEHGLWRAELRGQLKRIGDLERLTNRISAHMAGPKDLAGLRELLSNLHPIVELLQAKAMDALAPIATDLDPCEDVENLLRASIRDEPPATLAHIGVIREGFSDKLDEVLSDTRHARDWIADLEGVERERTGIKSLKVGFNKVFGYYLEVTKANTESVPEEYIRKQTLVNAERYITPELKEYETRVLKAEDRIRELEAELFQDVCARVGGQSARLLKTARAVARLDVCAGLAEVAARKGFVRPEVLEEDVIEIREGRHPVVEEFLVGKRFVPNDTVFDEGERIRILTGPNMSGKSTYLRQVALIALMSQMGSFVPASQASLGLTDRIFTRIGAQDEIHSGQSTFMVEMVETANILNHATRRSLIILDEIGRGTSTYDGISIAWAVVEYLHNHPRLRARTLFATHYHELTRLAKQLPGVRNFSVAVSEEGGRVVFLHRIVPGGADKSYGIHVGELAGLPRPVINRAQEILAQMESDSNGLDEGGVSTAKQLAFFPETNPMLEELERLDVDTLTPLEAINKLYEWQLRFGSGSEGPPSDKEEQQP
jgi:DNA mismatch repair protein MutS